MKKFQKRINYIFKDENLLMTALTHRSFINENKDLTEHNERLEFLWDAVLELSVTNYLYKKFPKAQEWNLTSFRSALVKKETLARVAKNLNIWEVMNLSKWEEITWWRESDHLLANTLEALIWAIYLDKWYLYVDKFINKFILVNLDSLLSEESHLNSKSKFQSFTQWKFKITPNYKVLNEFWPDHEKIFIIWVFLNEVCIWIWEWQNKQNAQERAAMFACKEFDI